MTKRGAEAAGARAAEEAADWVARLTAAPADPDLQGAFRAWHARSDEHRTAFALARAAYADIDRLPSRSSRMRSGVMTRAGLAVSGAVAAGVAALVLAPQLELVGADHHTRAGEVRSMVLEDGTRLWLDANSAIEVQYGAGARTVDLRRGRVFVEVMEGDARPFSIETEGAVVRDIGTAFAVDRTGDGFSVSVADGLVDVADRTGVRRLKAGQSRRFNGGDAALRAYDPDEQAWREGRLLFDRVPVKDAVATIGRYRSGRLVWMGGDAGRPVSGVLTLARLDEGLDTLAADNGLGLVRLPGVTFVIQKKS